MSRLTSDLIPRIEGTAVTVIDIYHAYVREDYEDAEIAHAYEVTLADVHYALAYYYKNAEVMRDMGDGYEVYTVEEAIEKQKKNIEL